MNAIYIFLCAQAPLRMGSINFGSVPSFDTYQTMIILFCLLHPSHPACDNLHICN